VHNVLFGVFLAIGLIACGGSAPPPAQPAPAPAPAATPAPAPAVTPAPAPAPAAGHIKSSNGNAFMEEALNRMQGFSDQICQCADKPCIERVSDAMTQWGQSMAKDAGTAQAMNETDSKMMSDITDRMAKCMTKVMSGS
jgi:hypothetical protein